MRKQKTGFLVGYDEMLRRIKPRKILCYGTPFEEMRGDVIPIDYAETNHYKKQILTAHVAGALHSGFVCKTGCVLAEKGGRGGAAGGGNSNDQQTFPGWDPSQKPGKDYEWRGRGDPNSGKGAWVNSKTGETLHPDLNHKEPFGPHWDYNYPGGGKGFRVFPDGSMQEKLFEGEWLYA